MLDFEWIEAMSDAEICFGYEWEGQCIPSDMWDDELELPTDEWWDNEYYYNLSQVQSEDYQLLEHLTEQLDLLDLNDEVMEQLKDELHMLDFDDI